MSITAEQAWDTFQIPIKSFILKYIHNESIAEDILQDVFLKMYSRIDTLKDEKKLQSWLYQIARHTIYDYYRDQKSIVALPESFDLPEEPTEEDVAQTLLPCLRDMVNRLPDIYREAILLTEYQGLTQRELAERLHFSFSGAKSRVQRAREKLKQMLLECCHFVLDRRGKIIEYHPRSECGDLDDCAKTTMACCATR
jgi:RNA polymerase sigma-70 factor (ECF subfamily)